MGKKKKITTKSRVCGVELYRLPGTGDLYKKDKQVLISEDMIMGTAGSTECRGCFEIHDKHIPKLERR